MDCSLGHFAGLKIDFVCSGFDAAQWHGVTVRMSESTRTNNNNENRKEFCQTIQNKELPLTLSRPEAPEKLEENIQSTGIIIWLRRLRWAIRSRAAKTRGLDNLLFKKVKRLSSPTLNRRSNSDWNPAAGFDVELNPELSALSSPESSGGGNVTESPGLYPSSCLLQPLYGPTHPGLKEKHRHGNQIFHNMGVLMKRWNV